MPRATDAQREEWTSDRSAIEYLEKRGWELDIGYSWKKPSPDYSPDMKELSAIGYLISEWDYGGIYDT